MRTAEDQVSEQSLGRIAQSAEYQDIFQHLGSLVLLSANPYSVNLRLNPELTNRTLSSTDVTV